MKKTDTKLKPLRANAGIEAAYRKQLLKLVDKMIESVNYWITCSYKNNEPVLAADAPIKKSPAKKKEERKQRERIASEGLPANEIQASVRKLARRWQRNFNRGAEELADYFATAAGERSDDALQSALKKAGFTIEFKMTPAARDVLGATVHENVGLIKSIPQRFFTNVESLVMQSVKSGRNLEELSTQLRDQYGVTKRRAALIARDQNNKATSAMNRARQTELGIERAVWLHSGAGKHPRPTHKAMNGKTYNIKKGMYDPKEKRYVLPGELINCRCTSQSIIPGFGS